MRDRRKLKAAHRFIILTLLVIDLPLHGGRCPVIKQVEGI
jgi:hypothetical protein